MNQRKPTKAKRAVSCFSLVLVLLFLLFAGLSLTFELYRPDRPLPAIVPGSSSKPTFVVQIVRPREGLPLGGLVPPELFGVDAELGFDSTSAGATYRVNRNALKLSGAAWELRLLFDDDHQIKAGSEVRFDLVFEDRVRRVRCTPSRTTAGKLDVTELENSDELSGNFTVELPNCEDAETGEPLGWPPKPLILRGSFDRL